MEVLVKKYQQKYKMVRKEMDHWDKIQSGFITQFKNAVLILEQLQVLQEVKNYGKLKSVNGIREGIIGKRMQTLEVILQSLKGKMKEFLDIVLCFEKILRDGKHLVNGASKTLTENQMQRRVGIQPSIANCIEGLGVIYEMHRSEHLLKLSIVSLLTLKKSPPSAVDFGALQQLLVDQPNIPSEEVKSIFDVIFAEEIC